MSGDVPIELYSINDGASAFRKEVICKQVDGSLLETIGKNRIIILDLLDELNDIIEVRGAYLNNTDALREVLSIHAEERLIDRYSTECMQLWKGACDMFMEWAKTNGNIVILLKLKLCDKYGNEEKLEDYAQQEWIEKGNQLLEQYYDYIQRVHPQCQVVELQNEFMYTQYDFKFGCYPYYYNRFAYFLLVQGVLREVRKILS